MEILEKNLQQSLKKPNINIVVYGKDKVGKSTVTFQLICEKKF